MTDLAQAGARQSAPPRRRRLLRPGWPLAALYLGFPVWWALGLAELIFFAAAAAMAVILWKQGSVRVPRGFAVWALFLVWLLAGVFTLRAVAPGTVPGAGVARFAGFGIWFCWYLAVTVAMLYVLNTARDVSTRWVVRLLAWMFVVTTAFGVLALLAPKLEFTSPMELLIPEGMASKNFVRTLIHPSVSSSVDFLGYVQARPTAPFAYSNSWGNNLALYLPFFMLAWFGRDAGWRRKAAPFVLVASVFPIVFSLNRGLWLALVLAAVYAAGRLAANGRRRALLAMLVSALVGGILLVSSPLYDTLALRVETPHSNERRAGTAETVLSTTAQGSPVVGYGATRTMQGSFGSLAGGSTAECRQCAAPPLGTQGFLWRLVLTTGFVGALLCLTFLALQFLHRARGPSTVEIAGCTALLVAVLCFFFYDSLGSALFTVFIAIGLMARSDLPEQEVRA